MYVIERQKKSFLESAGPACYGIEKAFLHCFFTMDEFLSKLPIKGPHYDPSYLRFEFIPTLVAKEAPKMCAV